MRSRLATLIVGALAALAALAAPAGAQTLFFADIFNPTAADGTVQRLDGTGLHPVATTGGGLRSVAVDSAAGKVYWCDVDNFKISRANFDGTNPEDIITTGLQFPAAIAIDDAHGKLYWGDQSAEEIWRANLDGSSPELVISTPFYRGLALDTANSKMYWTTSVTASRGNLMRADLDGFNSEVVINGTTAAFKPDIIALDVQRNRIYFSDSVTDTLRRSDLNGGGITPLYTNQFGQAPRGLAVHLKTGDLYWGRDVGDEPPTGEILRAVGGEPPHEPVLTTGIGYINSISIPGNQPPPCYPNCDGSTGTPALNVNDFVCFQSAFASGAPYADCDHNSALNVNDFVCFQSAFAAGCR